MMAARARVLSRPGVDVLRQWAVQPRSTSFGSQTQTQQVAQLYAATLSAVQLRDWAEAREMSGRLQVATADRKSTRLNSSHLVISYAVFCLKKKKAQRRPATSIYQSVDGYVSSTLASSGLCTHHPRLTLIPAFTYHRALRIHLPATSAHCAA